MELLSLVKIQDLPYQDSVNAEQQFFLILRFPEICFCVRMYFANLGPFTENNILQPVIDIESEIQLRIDSVELCFESTMWRSAVEDHIIENCA